MAYPGNPQGNDGYGYPDPNAPQGQYPQQQQPPQAPVSPYAPGPQQPPQAPVSPYGPVPQQPAPAHDQGYNQPTYQDTSTFSGYGDQPAAYNLDASVSAPPTAAMQAHPPMSAPPVSGPGMQQPVSGPAMQQPVAYGPVSAPPGYGQPGFPGAEPPKKKGVAVPILASLLALAVIAAAVFVGLYVDKSGKLDKSEKLAAQRQDTITTTQAELDKTKADLKAKTDELTKAAQDLRGTQADNTEAKRQRDVIGTCLKLLLDALEASNAGDRTTVQNKLAEMDKPCNEAEVLLGI